MDLSRNMFFQELLRAIPDSPVMLELGAYWGHYSMWLKKVHPASSVYLIEPDESNILAGQYNFHQNNYKGKFIRAFVGQGQFEVDKFMVTREIQRLNILHSDIQGFEIEMLDGCSKALGEKSIDYVFILTHSQELHDKVIERLGFFEYRIEVASNFDFETPSYDGLVFASSPLVKQKTI